MNRHPEVPIMSKQELNFIQLPSKAMQKVYDTVKNTAKSDMSFFITGETGTGKEGIARYIHSNGARQDKPLIALNCGRFTKEFLQSELFGHEKGAYTGATYRRYGVLERANGATLFLDEIAEMPLDTQATLLRVLDTHQFRRLGGDELITTDFQIIVATNKDIQGMIQQNEFREDLYYRIEGIQCHLPPLRQRKSDIAPLVDAFIREFEAQNEKRITGINTDALLRLEAASWPGNIRQLKNTVRTALATTEDERLKLEDMPYNFLSGTEADEGHTDPYPEFTERLLALWKTLPPGTHQTLRQEFSPHIPELLENLEPEEPLPTSGDVELLDITGMTQNEILRAVAQHRMKLHKTTTEAARSLGVDVRTLKKNADWTEKKS